MIFVTVGAQMSFDRLVRTVDAWAGRSGRTDVFAQIGPDAPAPKNIKWVRWLDPIEFKQHVQQADAVVSHAGMGSILTALTLGVPILVMPRRGDLRETRNDHQLDTAERLQELGQVTVALDEDDLVRQLDTLESIERRDRISDRASEQLCDAIRRFVEQDDPSR